MGRLISGTALVVMLVAACHAQAANKLFNGNLDLTVGTVYYDGFDPSVADDVPGWELFLGAADGSYVLVSPEAGQGHDLDTGSSAAGGGLRTAATSRVTVAPGLQYVASLTYDNYFGPTGASYFIDWFESDGDPLGSTGGLLADPNGPFGYDPYNQELSVIGVAPAGAALAGVRFESGNPGYAGLAADNFSFVPEPGTAALVVVGLLGAVACGRRRQK
jgi:hypothetical protein